MNRHRDAVAVVDTDIFTPGSHGESIHSIACQGSGRPGGEPAAATTIRPGSRHHLCSALSWLGARPSFEGDRFDEAAESARVLRGVVIWRSLLKSQSQRAPVPAGAFSCPDSPMGGLTGQIKYATLVMQWLTFQRQKSRRRQA